MRSSSITAILFLIPVLASAQGFPGGGQHRGGGRKLPELESRAPADTAANNVALLIANRGRLILEEDQVMQLSALDARLRFQQDSLKDGIDSLRTQLTPPGDGFGVMTPEQWQHMREKRRVLASMIAAQRDVEQTATDSALAVLSEVQRRKASALISDSEQRRADAQRSADADSTGASRRGVNFPGGGKRPD